MTPPNIEELLALVDKARCVLPKREEDALRRGIVALGGRVKHLEHCLLLCDYAVDGKQEQLRQMCGGSAPEDCQEILDKAHALHAENANLRGFEGAYSIASDCAKLRDEGEPDCGWCQRCLRAERDMYHDALIARHGGEPVALLAELDEAREQRDALRAERDEAREALAEIARGKVPSEPGYHEHTDAHAQADRAEDDLERCRNVARAFLGPPAPQSGEAPREPEGRGLSGAEIMRRREALGWSQPELAAATHGATCTEWLDAAERGISGYRLTLEAADAALTRAEEAAALALTEHAPSAEGGEASS